MSVEMVPRKLGVLECFSYASWPNRFKKTAYFLELLLQLNGQDEDPKVDFGARVFRALALKRKDILPHDKRESYFTVENFNPKEYPNIGHLFPNRFPLGQKLHVYVGQLKVAERSSYILAFSPQKRGDNIPILLFDNSLQNNEKKENAVMFTYRNLQHNITFSNFENLLEEFQRLFTEEPKLVEQPKVISLEPATVNNQILYLANHPNFVPQTT